jgi:tetratricopeptide (TPR) repeat protein
MKSITGLGETITAQIGSGVNKDALNGLVFSLGREGAEALRKGDYETALDRFTACTKVNEKICKKDDINLGASLHNMATALHYLGDTAHAEKIYEQAKAVFEAQQAGPFRPSQKHRIKFIEERLTLLRFGAKPSAETYIDEFGVERVTAHRMDIFDESPVLLAERAEKAYWKGVGHAKNKIWGLAQECFEDAISLAERAGGTESGRIGAERLMLCHNNLGVVLEEQGQLDDAIQCLRVAERMLFDLPGGIAADPDRVQKLRRVRARARISRAGAGGRAGACPRVVDPSPCPPRAPFAPPPPPPARPRRAPRRGSADSRHATAGRPA